MVASSKGAEYMLKVWEALASPELCNADLIVVLSACLAQLAGQSDGMRFAVMHQLQGTLDILAKEVN